MAESWDIFFSYRRHDLPRAQPLLAALAEAGIRVWWDKKDIPDHEPISEEIRRGLANSKALIAFYSRTYRESRPCQEELRTAWVAAEQFDPTANCRVWILNPEDSLEHIPELLRDQQIPRIAETPDWSAIAQRFRNRLETLGPTVLGVGIHTLPRPYGTSLVQARRFTGRVVEMWDLHGKLTANRISIITGVSGQPAVYVCGLAGNGKSLLAREYAIRFGAAYPGGIFWLNAYGHDDTKGPIDASQREAIRRDQLREFTISLGLPIDDLKPNEIEAAFWLAIEKRGQRCLWIVDDLPAGELETTWYAKWSGASTPVTTRSKEYGALGTILPLGVLSAPEAFILLASHRNPTTEVEKKTAIETIDLLGCHPLAVEIAGSYLARGVEAFESYRNELLSPKQDALELGALLSEKLPTGHERSISGTLLKSIRLLGPEGLELLRLASLLAVAPIPLSFLVEVFEVLDPNGEARVRSLQADDQVLKLSLCEFAGTDARTVHTLVSRTVRFAFPDDEEIGKLRSAAIDLLTKKLAAFNQGAGYSKVATVLPHARHLSASEVLTEREAYLALWVATHDSERADYGSARKLQERAVTALRRLLGEENPDTLRSMRNLATTLRAMDNLALTLKYQGDLVEARKLQERVVTARRRLLGEDHPGTLAAMNSLAETLGAMGDLVEARILQEQALAGFRQELGEDHPETLTALNDLAQTKQNQGDLAEARNLQERVVTAGRRVLGEEHPDTLTAMNNLALNMQAQGDLVEARKLQERVVTARRRLLGEEHPDTLASVNNLAGTLYAQGDLAEARKLEEQVLSADTRTLGEEHPNTLGAMNNLAATLWAQGNLVEARKLEEKVLAARRRLLGEEHPDTLRVMNNLARTLYAQGDVGLARKLQEQAFLSFWRGLGEKHPETIAAKNNLIQMMTVGSLVRRLIVESADVLRYLLGVGKKSKP